MIENNHIKIIDKTYLQEALDLVNEVFNEFVAVDYEEQGKITFEKYLQHKYAEVSKDIETGHKKVWGYLIDGKIVGVAAIRDNSHIALFFVGKEHQKKGIGKTLFETIKEEVVKNKSEKITVNSSPYAVKIYEKLGFIRTAERQEKDGIIFYPMQMSLDNEVKNDNT